MKTGVIDVGGGLRGIYAAGVFDRCIDENILFDVCIGVSAGSANCCSYLSHQKGRNYSFYAEYPFRKEYMSLANWIHKKSYLDLDYVYGTLSNSNGENPVDYPSLMNHPSEFIVVATDALSGQAKYFTKEDVRQDDYNVFKASSAIPFVCHPYEVYGHPYFDGALGDPVPLKKAFSMGCDRVILILTKPADVIRTNSKDALLASLISGQYPKAAEQLRLRAQHYNGSVIMAKMLQKEGKVLIISPDDTCGVDTLTKDHEALDQLYRKGYRDGAAIVDFMNR